MATVSKQRRIVASATITFSQTIDAPASLANETNCLQKRNIINENMTFPYTVWILKAPSKWFSFIYRWVHFLCVHFYIKWCSASNECKTAHKTDWPPQYVSSLWQKDPLYCLFACTVKCFEIIPISNECTLSCDDNSQWCSILKGFRKRAWN